MTRYLRILSLFWSTSLAAEMEYRLNFTIATITSLGGLAGGLFGLFLFYRTGAKLGDWEWPAAVLVMAIFTILEGFANVFLTPNLSRIVRHVQNGTLDFVLLKPIDSQFWLSTRNFSPNGLPEFITGMMLAGYAVVKLQLSPLHVALGLVPMILALIVLYDLWFILATTSIWFVKIYNVTSVLQALLEAGRFPVSAYPLAYRVVLTFVVPVIFLTTVPAKTMLGEGSFVWIGSAAAIAATLFFVSRQFWRLAMRHYTSASS